MLQTGFDAELARAPAARETGMRQYPPLLSSAYFAALDSSPLPTTFLTPDRVYRFVNRAYERWFGLHWEEVVGRTVVEVIGPAAADTVKPFVDAALKGASVQFESTLPYPNRGARRMRVTYAGAASSGGEVAGFFGFLEDVTAQYDAESAVTAALDGLADGYFTVDRQMRFTFVNEMAARHYGLTPKDMINRHIYALFRGVSRGPAGKLLEAVLETRKPQRRVLPSVVAAGRTFLWDIVPLLTGGAAVVMQDVTGDGA